MLSLLELKVTLLGTKPSVYRILHIEKSRTFYELHIAIQIAFGWENHHMHEFRINDECIGDKEFLDDANALEGSHTRLSQKIVFEKQIFSYVYDFGDYWKHSIQLVKFIEPKRTFYPKCIKGERNSPPEDCGGVRGFQTFKEIMKDKKHPEHKEMIAWNDGPFDEDFFSLLFINDDFKHFDTMVKASLEFDEEEE